MKKKIISLFMAVVMICSLGIMAGAADITTVGGEGTTPVVLTAEAATFKVTVPTSLPVSVDAAGVVTVAGGATITNLSAGAVKVTDVAIEAANSWELVDYQIDTDEFKVDDKMIGLQLNSEAEMTGADGDFAFDAAKWARLDATGGTADTYTFEYDAVVAPQSAALTDATVANVIFTIDWDAVA